MLTATKETIFTSIFLSLFANEVIAIDNQSWISIHYYLVATWKHMPILFTLEQLAESGIATYIKVIIISTLMKFGGLFKNLISKCLICLGTNGTSTFQGVKSRVIILMRTNEQVLYFIRIHYMTHKTNLLVQSCSQCLWFSNWRISFKHHMSIFLAPQNTILNSLNLLKL
jgi:hypothetical protein